MAEDLDDGEFWLPSQFLTEDDILVDFRGYTNKSSQEKDGFHRLGWNVFGCGSFGVSLDLSSPGGQSVTGSTEAESDEEEHLAGLTREMARSTLGDYSANSKGWILSVSPQSTLSTVGGGCDCNQGSSRGSPNGPVSPPPVAAVKGRNQNDAALDLLYAAAGEVARLRMRSGQRGTGFFDSSNRGLLYPRKGPITTDANSSAQYSPHLQTSQFTHLKQQQLMKQTNGQPGVWGPVKSIGQFQTTPAAHPISRQQNKTIVNGVARRANGHRRQPQPQGLSLSAFPPLQHPNHQHQNQQNKQQQGGDMGMKAVFLGTPTVTKGVCVGTGVFFPRRFESQTDSRKKPDGTMSFRATAGFLSSQRRNSNSRTQAGNSHEIQLPQEWSY
ncbi:hypothetical protein Ancab_014745 [Ancistrocladus abbreviatus]